MVQDMFAFWNYYKGFMHRVQFSFTSLQFNTDCNQTYFIIIFPYFFHVLEPLV
jgi:hypothetical protein